jgi:putative ABC transport system substrate-binding protein
MRRRDFITLLGGALVAGPVTVRAQQPAALPVIGALGGLSAAQWADRGPVFRRGLGEIGYLEGRNVAIESRMAEGQLDRLPWRPISSAAGSPSSSRPAPTSPPGRQ